MSSEFLRSVKQWEFEWKGDKFKLPVFYYDNTSITAIYTAATEKAKKLLPHPDMRPIELYPGRCLIAFTAFEYRKTDIDPYNEFSIAFLVSMKFPQIPALTAGYQMLRRQFTAYVWKLPVTTEIARMGGVELYGYPKFLADIVFTRTPATIECKLVEKGEHILTVKGKVLPTSAGKLTKYTTYSILDNIPLAANVVTNPIQFVESRDKNAASLELGGTHPICTALREIDLSPMPLVYQYAPETEAILFAGRNLIDC